MLQEADVRVLDLCQRVRQAASPQERRRLMIVLRQSWPRVSDPVGLAGEGAYFFGIFGHEREGALERLAALTAVEQNGTLSGEVRAPEDPGSTSATEPPAQPH